MTTTHAQRRSPAWHDAQYDARAGIPEQAAIRQGWADRSAHTRATRRCVLDIPYGADATETLDVFLPAAPDRTGRAPVLVYIHGGYWRALDKRDQSFVAAPFVDAGTVVVLPNYALAPAVSVRQIVLQMVQAVAWVHRHIGEHGGDPRRIVVAGHSAGGHLAAMMLACRWAEVAPDLPPQVLHAALAISGVFDLAPLRHAPFLAPDLKLSAAEARALSPACMHPPVSGPLVAVVGGDESAEFHRQTRLIHERWGEAVVPVCETLPGRHHMNVLHDLAEPDTRLHTLARSLLDI